ncbi:hypothetical protein OBV_32280 [Oscillibacter valericigenes Sjm18-20]|nr:hypothetical protein OBV_32280 [Oscillibacter valericigenes Sjm18-20]
MKKKITAMVLAGLLTFSMIGTVAAAESPSVLSKSAQSSTVEVVPRAEETEWHYRVFNGKTQMRLWSITENKWLTDWIDV